MAYVYRTSYVSDFTMNPKVETIHFYQERGTQSKQKKVSTGTDLFDFDQNRLEESWTEATEEFTELLKQSPEVIEEEIIKLRIKNTYQYAKRKNLNPDQCFQYVKKGTPSQSNLFEVDRILIQIRSPLDQLYVPITIVEQGPITLEKNYFSIMGQSRIDAIYNRSQQEFILQNSNQIDFDPEKEQYHCYHYLPESMKKVKKLTLF